MTSSGAPLRLAYCPVCRGVLHFAAVRVPGERCEAFECERCGTAHRGANPGATERGRRLRFRLYAAAAVSAPSCFLMGQVLLAPDSPPVSAGQALALAALAALGLVCLVRSIALGGAAARYEGLTRWERHDLARALCPGMVRSDVVDALARRGWRIGKIRSALEVLQPMRPSPTPPRRTA